MGNPMRASGESVIASLRAERFQGTLGTTGLPSLSKVSYTDWAQPEVAVRARKPVAWDMQAPAAETSHGTGRTDQSANQLIRTRQEAYFEQGREAFQRAEYREAYDRFALADAAGYGGVAERSRIKVAMIHAAVASGQIESAISTLGWLLSSPVNPMNESLGQGGPSTTDLVRDSGFLMRSSARSLYGDNMEYPDHVRLVEKVVIQNPGEPAIRALFAFLLWQRRDDAAARSRALFQAERVKNASGDALPWSNLYALMRRAEAQAEAGPESVADESVADLLPFAFERPETE